MTRILTALASRLGRGDYIALLHQRNIRRALGRITSGAVR